MCFIKVSKHTLLSISDVVKFSIDGDITEEIEVRESGRGLNHCSVVLSYISHGTKSVRHLIPMVEFLKFYTTVILMRFHSLPCKARDFLFVGLHYAN